MTCPTCNFESFVTIAGHRWCCGCGRLDSPDGDGFSIPALARSHAATRQFVEVTNEWMTAHLDPDDPIEAILLADGRAALSALALDAPEGGQP